MVTEDIVKTVFVQASTIQKHDSITEALLLKFNTTVERFYEKAN